MGQTRDKRVQWFTHDRFGMFIHWGVYSVPARGEWVKSAERITTEDYQAYVDAFKPRHFNPKAWARLAKAAGMKYAVMTAKHHDGFCMFDSQYTDYKCTNLPGNPDFIKDYVEAFRAEGLKVGLYYSLIDWHHPDYPHYGHMHHPMRENEGFKNHAYTFDNYLDYLHRQAEELSTKYGKIDIFWFDFSYADRVGEKWRATELVRMLRRHNPDVLIDNRLEAGGGEFGSLLTDTPTEYSGDFASPEQIIPPRPLTTPSGVPRVWEACITGNGHWGYAKADENWKPGSMIVKALVECVSKGGNLLFNVGPDADGRIPQGAVDALEVVAGWMAKNSESIHGCGMAGIDRPEFGRATRRDNTLYFHTYDNPVGYLPLHGLKADDIAKITLLETGAELDIVRNWVTNNYPDIVYVAGITARGRLLNEIDTVVKVELT